MDPLEQVRKHGVLYLHTRGKLRAFAEQDYTPSNVTWSMVRPDNVVMRKKDKEERRERLVARALEDFDTLAIVNELVRIVVLG